MMMIAAAIMMSASCDTCECEPQTPYDDTAIKEAIKDLQNRVAALEKSVQDNVKALQSMASLGSVTACEYDAKTGKTTITLTDGTKFTINQTVKGTSLITVKQDEDGKYYWAVCEDGVSTFLIVNDKKVPVAVTPALKISENDEWMISVDGGATWVATGIYQQVSSPEQPAPDQPTPDQPSQPETPSEPAVSFFKDVKMVDGYLVLTLMDDTVIKVAVVGENIFATTVDTLWFAKESVDKIALLQMNGVKAYTITEKPEGWKAYVSTDTLHIVSPADISAAAKNGTVKLLGLFEGGANPEIVSVEVVYEKDFVLSLGVAGDVKVTVAEHAFEDVGAYVIGAWKAEDFAPEAVAAWLNTEEGYVSEPYTETKTFNISQLVADYKESEAYVVFAAAQIPVMQILSGAMAYTADALQTVEIGSTQAVAGFSDIRFDSAHLHLEFSDMPKYYGGFSELGYWEAFGRDNALEFLNEGNYDVHTASVYDGPANSFPDRESYTQILPSSEYVVWVAPYAESKTYTENDFILYSFKTPGIVADASIPAPAYEVTEITYGGFTAKVTPASGAYKTYAAIRKSTSIPEDELASVIELIDIEHYSLSGTELVVESNSFSADDEVYLVAVSVTQDGKYGKVLKEKVELKQLDFSSDISVKVDDISYGVGDVTLTLAFTGNPSTISYYYALTDYHTDDEIQTLLSKGQLGDAVNDLEISKLVDGRKIYLDKLTLDVEYKFYAVVKNASGVPSHLYKTTFTPNASSIDYIMSDNPQYTYGMPVLSGTKSGTRYTLKVDMPEQCRKYWLFKGDPEYFTGDVYIDTDKLVTMQLELSGETVHTESIESLKYTNVNSYTRIYMAWLDDQGRYHAIYEFNPNAK